MSINSRPGTIAILLRTIAILLLAANVIFAAQGAVRETISVLAVTSVPFTQLPVFVKKVSNATRNFSVSYVIVTPQTDNVDLALPKFSDGGGSSLWDFWRDEHADAAFTGGYLESVMPATPAGLLKYNGKLINDAKQSDPVLSGVVCFGKRQDKNVVSIFSFNNQGTFHEWSSCIQSGPLLALSGQEHDDLGSIDANVDIRTDEDTLRRKAAGKLAMSEGAYERAFIIRTRDGKFVLGITSPVSLYALRSLVLLDTAHGGFDAVDAINMTGWETAGLVVSAPDPFVAGKASTLLPNAIVVHRRKQMN